MSSTTTRSEATCCITCRFISAPTAGCTMPFRSFSASGSANAMAASAGRSSEPSAAITCAPNRSANLASTGDPGCCTSRTTWSASTMTAPRAASAALTVDLPEPMPPVSPTRIMSGSVGCRRK